MLRQTLRTRTLSVLSNASQGARQLLRGTMLQTRQLETKSSPAKSSVKIEKSGGRASSVQKLLRDAPSRQLSMKAEKLKLSEAEQSPTELFTLKKLFQLINKSKEKPDFSNTLFFNLQHSLGTTFDLYKVLKGFNANFDQLFHLSKDYTAHPGTEEAMKKAGIQVFEQQEQRSADKFPACYVSTTRDMRRAADEKADEAKTLRELRILDGSSILDDTSSRDSSKVVSVEQTTSGLDATRTSYGPTIEVGSCPSKTLIEPIFVARAIIRRFKEIQKELTADKDKRFPAFKKQAHFFLENNPTIGIIGLGHIGLALLRALIKEGYRKFIIYDSHSAKVEEAIEMANKVDQATQKKSSKKTPEVIIRDGGKVSTIIANADIIFGATGKNIALNETAAFNTISNPKFLLSVSSKTTEWEWLLSQYAQHQREEGERVNNPMEHVAYKNGFGAELYIAQLGKPLPFDRSMHAVPADEIDMTRTLLLIGAIQAYYMQKDMYNGNEVSNTNYRLSPTLVAWCTRAFLANLPQEKLKELKEHNPDIERLQDPHYLSTTPKESKGGKIYEPFEAIAKKWLPQNDSIVKALNRTNDDRNSSRRFR